MPYMEEYTKVSDLTNGQYTELKYMPSNMIQGDFLQPLVMYLKQAGITQYPLTNSYDKNMEDAVKEFQRQSGRARTGIVTDTVLEGIYAMAKRKMNDTITEPTSTSNNQSYASNNDTQNNISSPTVSYDNNAHYNSFFNTERERTFRRNHQNIKIVMGNDTITKTIVDIFVRSVSVEVDTSGNPISEVYEFVAKDIKESDESTDVNKYIGL